MSAPHPSWSDPERDLGAERCSHGVDFTAVCLQCRTGVDYTPRRMKPIRVVIIAVAFTLTALLVLYGYIELVALVEGMEP